MVLKEPFVMSHIYFNNVLVMKLFLPPFKSTDEVLMQASVEGPGKKSPEDGGTARSSSFGDEEHQRRKHS